MRLYGILNDEFIGEYIIDNISANIEDFKPMDNVYYTDNLFIVNCYIPTISIDPFCYYYIIRIFAVCKML